MRGSAQVRLALAGRLVRRGPAHRRPLVGHAYHPGESGLGTSRVVNRATVWTPTYVGETFTVLQTDAAKHRACIIKARKFIAAYCPRTPICIDTPAVAGRGLPDYRWG